MWIEKKLFDLVAKESSTWIDGSVGKEAKGKGYGMGRGGQKCTQREPATVSLKERREKEHIG